MAKEEVSSANKEIKEKRVSKTALTKALEALKKAKPKESNDISALAAVRQLRRQIERLLKLDYSYAEIAVLLASCDVEISGERLKSLHAEVKRSSRKKTPRRNDENGANEKPSTKVEGEQESSSVESDSVEEADSPDIATEGKNGTTPSKPPRTKQRAAKKSEPSFVPDINPEFSFVPKIDDNNEL